MFIDLKIEIIYCFFMAEVLVSNFNHAKDFKLFCKWCSGTEAKDDTEFLRIYFPLTSFYNTYIQK